jgi:hypothetical protein
VAMIPLAGLQSTLLASQGQTQLERPMMLQVESDQLQIERAAARRFVTEPLGRELNAAGARLLNQYYHSQRRWGDMIPERNVRVIATDLSVPVALGDSGAGKCAHTRGPRPCEIVGVTPLVTLAAPEIKGDTATIEINLWLARIPADAQVPLAINGPDSFFLYLMVRERNGTWRVERLLRSSMR